RPTRFNRIRPIIEQLDRATDQVMIESKFVEVTNRDIKNIGVNWASLANYNVSVGGIKGTFDRQRGQTSTGGVHQNNTDTINNVTGTKLNNTPTVTNGQNSGSSNSSTVTSTNGAPTITATTGTTGGITANTTINNISGTTGTTSDTVNNALTFLNNI